jgi:hypothetical protein
MIAPQDEWFSTAPENQKPALDALRAIVLSAAQGLVEEIKWSRPCYSTPTGMFCYLHRTKNHVTIGFQQGASLKDPKSLLEGTGKDMRHIKITDAGDIDRSAILHLVQQAIKLT